MALKYQDEIDKLGIEIECPSKATEVSENIEAYRWVHEPVTDDRNFLPNILYDRIMKNSSTDYSKMSGAEKCRRSGASFFTKIDFAKGVWKHVNSKIVGKFNLEYTHVAAGVLKKGDGVMGEIKRGHFGFYEFVGSREFKKEFSIVDTII